MIDYTAFNLQAFVNWVADQPADVTYDAGDCDICALAQFGYPGLATCEAQQAGIYTNGVYHAILTRGDEFTSPTFRLLSQRLHELGYDPR